ncbi:MAG: FemAB family PEP-CTERM system-associated protein [Gemmatimonadota bacterium]|nr:MAG: FemAB family PEP-CTERM system-associated protein [Gemmatimonadota bacterium]
MKPVAAREPSVVTFDGDIDAWNDFVAPADGSTFCHLAEWREIMADVLGHEPIYKLILGEDGEWQGTLPLVRVRSRIFGHYLISMPFLNYGGPIGSREARMRLTTEAVAVAQRHGVDLLELRARQPVPADLKLSDRKITVLLELPTEAEALWREGFNGKLRSQIRRPQKEGMEVRFGLEQVDAFYEVFARNMRDLGTPVLPRKLFERMAAVFPDLVVVGTVYWRETPVAAGWGFKWRDEYEMTWASALREYSRMAPNMLLYWSFMERMIQQGTRVFNFGRCTPGGGTHRFKAQWGGVDTPLPWAQWAPGVVGSTPSPERPLFKVATAAWGRMPLGLANRLGPFLARQLP